MASERDLVTDSCGFVASVTFTCTLTVPALAGVPEISPLVGLIDIPLGSPVALQLKGVVPPVAATVWL